MASAAPANARGRTPRAGLLGERRMREPGNREGISMHGLRIVRRHPTEAPHDWPAHLHPVLQRVYAARGVACPDEIGHRLAGLLPPDALGGIERATGLLANAIDDDAHILIAGDFDCDGATGCAVGVRGLRMLGARHVGYVVPDRAVHGYGLTPALVATMQPAPDLIVTVDNGIASLAGVAAAKARGCKVIVTDHHLPGPALPDADAIVNPNAAGDGFASKNLCGVGVMFYLLLALRARLGKRDAIDLVPLLDLIALGTVADLVPLDHNNRALVEAGLRRIRAGHACAGIAALFEVAQRDVRHATASDLGFAIGPRINAAGRLEDMSIFRPAMRRACRCSIPVGTPAWSGWSRPRSRSGCTGLWWRSHPRATIRTCCAVRRVRCRGFIFGTRLPWSMRAAPD